MSKHLQLDMEILQQDVLALSAAVEEMIDQATRALIERRRDLAETVVAADDEVDRREVRIEEECLKMLALHQPVAGDLRRITSVLKINNDLERVADLAVNIAERALSLDAHPAFPIPPKVERMVALTLQMVRGALDAFVTRDAAGARRIIDLDSEVDRLNVDVINELQAQIAKKPELTEPALHCFSAARHVERIADHATNIAEDVIYLIVGDIVRHRHATPAPRR